MADGRTGLKWSGVELISRNRLRGCGQHKHLSTKQRPRRHVKEIISPTEVRQAHLFQLNFSSSWSVLTNYSGEKWWLYTSNESLTLGHGLLDKSLAVRRKEDL